MDIRQQNEMYRELYNLDLGGEFVNGATSFLRVPGGWIFIKDDGLHGYTCFIPFSNEFQ